MLIGKNSLFQSALSALYAVNPTTSAARTGVLSRCIFHMAVMRLNHWDIDVFLLKIVVRNACECPRHIH
jgi:hypothetical protein